MRRAEPLKVERILSALNSAGVNYLVIGALAATLQGSPLRTDDLDICPADDPDNLTRLATALTTLDAKGWDPRKELARDLVFDREVLEVDRLWILITKYGPLDIVFDPAGTGGYRDLSSSAVTLEIDGLTVRAAALADVIRSKEATGREKDRQQLPVLRRLAERLEADD